MPSQYHICIIHLRLWEIIHKNTEKHSNLHRLILKLRYLLSPVMMSVDLSGQMMLWILQNFYSNNSAFFSINLQPDVFRHEW